MRFSLILALLPVFAACNTTSPAATTAAHEEVIPDQEFVVIALEHASASDLARSIEDLVESASRAGRRGSSSRSDVSIRILADQRTNSLLITAPTTSMILIKDLVAALDVQLQE